MISKEKHFRKGLPLKQDTGGFLHCAIRVLKFVIDK
jgi:hypothetical protein